MEIKQKKVFHSRPIFYAFLTLMLAIATSRYLFVGDVSYIMFVCILFTGFVGYCFWAKKILIFLVVLATFVFGMGWYVLGENSFQGKSFSGECQVVGRISDDISVSKYETKSYVVLKDVFINGEKTGNLKLTVSTKNSDEVVPGDIISFTTEVKNAKLFTLRKFDSSLYRDKIKYTADVQMDDCFVQGNNLDLDESFRLKIKNQLYQIMGETNGSVAFAVLFGDKSDVDGEIKDTYKTAGIIHLLTVSGLHVGFLVTLLGFVLKKCRVRGIYNFLLCAVCLGLYAYVCGFAPSIMRAGIMGLVLLATKLSGKCYDNLNTLGLAGLIILLISPLSALDSGFLMSFFCVLGIFVVSPWLTKFFKKFLPKLVAESFSVSIAAQIGILPFMASFYSSLNLLTFFINLIVIPIFSVIYPILFCSIFLVALMPFLGFLLQACGWGLSLVFNIAGFFSTTHLVVDLQPMGMFVVAFVFIFLFLTSRYFMAGKKTKILSCSSAFTICLISVGLSYFPHGTESSISYCFNNNKEVVLLTNSQGENVFVDFGYYNFTNNIKDCLNVQKVQTAFLLQNSKCDIATARQLGIENIVRCDSGQGFDEEVLVKQNQTGKVGGFSFVFRAFNEKIVGLEISFDQTKVFILKNRAHTEEALKSVANQNYDFVVLGKKADCSPYFSSSEYILSYYPSSFVDSSFLEDGNISYKIVGKNYKRRALD